MRKLIVVMICVFLIFGSGCVGHRTQVRQEILEEMQLIQAVNKNTAKIVQIIKVINNQAAIIEKLKNKTAEDEAEIQEEANNQDLEEKDD